MGRVSRLELPTLTISATLAPTGSVVSLGHVIDWRRGGGRVSLRLDGSAWAHLETAGNVPNAKIVMCRCGKRAAAMYWYDGEWGCARCLDLRLPVAAAIDGAPQARRAALRGNLAPAIRLLREGTPNQQLGAHAAANRALGTPGYETRGRTEWQAEVRAQEAEVVVVRPRVKRRKKLSGKCKGGGEK